MPSGPSLFDDEDPVAIREGGDDRSVGDGAAPSRVADPPTTNTSRRATRAPNYLFRRAVVVGGVVAVLATAGIVVGRMIGTGASDDRSGSIGADWNRIVLIDDRTGRIIVDDAAGDEVARVESDVGAPTAAAVVASTVVVAGSDGLAVVDIADESVERFELDADAIVRPAGSALTLIAARSDDGRSLLVHGPSGDVLDTDLPDAVVGARYEFAEAVAAPSGRDVLVTDSGNFQSVLFSFERDGPSFFPGLALAVDADRVVTAQNIGADATISVFDHDGEPISTGRTPSVRAGMLGEAGLVLVTVDGAIVTMVPSSGETDDVAALDIGTVQFGNVTTDGDRLVIAGSDGTAIVGADGSVIGSYAGLQPVGAGRPPAGSRCVTLIDDAGSQISVVDVTDGTVLVEAAGREPVLADASGCVVGFETSDGFDVASDDGVEQFQTGDALVAIALDGASVVAERDGRLVLIQLGTDQPSDPLDLGPDGRSVHFTNS